MYKMHMKFAVFGASGSGKSTLIELLHKINPNVTVHRKDTTRKPRFPAERTQSLDLRFLRPDQFESNRVKGRYDIVYIQRTGDFYGVRRDQLERAFHEKEIHFVIINDIAGIQQFKCAYPDVRAMYIHADPEQIPENLQKREGIDIDERKRRVISDYMEFIENSTLFDHIVVNFWEKKNAIRQMQNILNLYVKHSITNL